MKNGKPWKRWKAKPRKVGRTEAQKEASVRDGRYCLWSLHVDGVLRRVEEVHHIFGRRNSDEKETCISLSAKVHSSHHQTGKPSTKEFVELMVRLYGYDYSKYRQFMKD